MKKAQSQILGAVLITAIVMLVSGSAFVWGKPLIDKSTDKSKVDGLLLKMSEIDSAIKQAASTGSSKTVKVRLQEHDELSVSNDGGLKFKSYILVPVISTKDYAPLNSYELAVENELIGVETIETVSESLGICSLPHDGVVKNASLLLEGENFHVVVYNTSNSYDYDHVCIINHTNQPTNDECANEFQTIPVNGVDYVIQRIDKKGEFVYFTGDEVENVGIMTRDVPGVISGKSRVLSSTEGLLTTLVLNYRGLIDNNGVIHRIIIQCENNCLSTKSETLVKIIRSDIIRTGSSIDTYINIGLN
ncbi:MAG: hypothetical protein GON13_02865 [Nanoarchaeota archaeon]|nr:hypothetical protein [Nanoarchaeota archaeon]